MLNTKENMLIQIVDTEAYFVIVKYSAYQPFSVQLMWQIKISLHSLIKSKSGTWWWAHIHWQSNVKSHTQM